MQTFLPWPDFEQSARSLDVKRLGKQRVECLQIVRGLTVEGHGFRNHPAVRMWHGFEEALGRYSLTCCEVWVEGGRADTCAEKIAVELSGIGLTRVRTQAGLAAAGATPPWLGDAAFHLSHRSALVRKDPACYAPLFPDTPDDLDYLWPGDPTEPGATSR